MSIVNERLIVKLQGANRNRQTQRADMKDLHLALSREIHSVPDDSELDTDSDSDSESSYTRFSRASTAPTTTSELKSETHKPGTSKRLARRRKVTMYKVGSVVVHDVSGLVEGGRSYHSRYSHCLRRYISTGSPNDLVALRREMLALTRTKSGLMRNGLNKCRVSGFCRAVVSVAYTRFERTITVPHHVASQVLIPTITDGRWSYRTLSSGDWCIVLRNPTLDQRATQPWIVKVDGVGKSVTNPYSLKLPSSQTTNLAADFDGDTCTLWFLSNADSINEASTWKMDIESRATPPYQRDLVDRRHGWTRDQLDATD
eukprot:1391951-Amorphochlora_amoeboformis.AAC.1